MWRPRRRSHAHFHTAAWMWLVRTTVIIVVVIMFIIVIIIIITLFKQIYSLRKTILLYEVFYLFTMCLFLFLLKWNVQICNNYTYIYRFPSFPGRLLLWWEYWRLWNVQENYQVCRFYHEYSSHEWFQHVNIKSYPLQYQRQRPGIETSLSHILIILLLEQLAKRVWQTTCKSQSSFLNIYHKVQKVMTRQE